MGHPPADDLLLQLRSATAQGSSCCTGDLSDLVLACFEIGSVGFKS